MDRPEHAGLRHLALNARDLDAMRRFYVDLLGFRVEWEPDADNVYLTSGCDNLALHRAAAAGAVATDGGGVPASASPDAFRPLDHLGVVVRAAADVDRWALFLEHHGVIMVALPRTHRDGARSCYVRDPDGNTVQIIHHPPISSRI